MSAGAAAGRRLPRARRDALAGAGVAAVGLAAAWRALAPFGERFRDHLAPNLQDPLFNLYLLARGARQVALGLRDYWNAGFYFPEPQVVALSDHLAGPAALAGLLGGVGVGPIAASNLLVLASFPLAAATVFALLGRAGLRAEAAALGALAFAVSPFRWLHLEHLPLLWMPLLALVLWSFDRLLERPAPARAVAFVLLYALHLTGGVYLAYLVHLPLAAIAWVRRRQLLERLRRPRARWTLLATAALSALGAFAAFRPYLEAAARGYRRTEGEMAIWGATLASYLTPSRANRYFPEAFDALHRSENALFPGIAIAVAVGWLALRRWPRWRAALGGARRPALLAAGAALALCALALADLATWTGREFVDLGGYALRIRGYSRPALLLLLGALAIAAGFGGRPSVPRKRSPRALLRRALLLQGACALALSLPVVAAPASRCVPGLLAIRAPSRCALFALLAGALLLAAAASLLARRLRPRRRGAIVLGAGLVLLLPELLPRPFAWHRIERPEEFPEVHREIARRGLDGAIAELPFARGDLRSDLVRMWRSTLHGNPTSAGYSGFEPEHARELRAAEEREPPAALLARLRALGFRYLLLHLDELEEGRRDDAASSWSDAITRSNGSLLWRSRSSLLAELGSE
jgi:hypothetical protein